MTHSRRFTVGARLVLAVLTIAGTAMATAPSSSRAAVPHKQATDPLKLTIWLGDAGNPAAVNALIKAFNDANPSTQVITGTVSGPQGYEANVLTKFAVGAKPDILYYQTVPSSLSALNPAKNLQDLADLGIWNNYTSPVEAQAGVLQGKHYAAELDYPSFFTAWYNKNVFAKYDLTPPTNFSQLLATCDALRKVVPKNVVLDPIYMGAGDKWPVQVLPSNLMDSAVKKGFLDALNHGKAHLTDPLIVRALQGLDMLNQHNCFEKNLVTGSYANEQQRLVRGLAAMVFNGSWMISGLPATTGYSPSYINQTVGNLPLSYDGPSVGVGAPASPMLPKTGDAAREAAARKFLQFATSPAGYAVYLAASGAPPVFKGYKNPPGVLTPILTADSNFRKYGVTDLGTGAIASWGGDFATWCQEILLHEKTPAQVAQLMDRTFYQDAHAHGIAGF